MPRYVVQRTFQSGLHIPCSQDGAKACIGVVERNAAGGVNWVQSFVSLNKEQSFCIYDGPDPEAICLVAERSGLPVDSITEVRVLNPYFYH